MNYSCQFYRKKSNKTSSSSSSSISLDQLVQNRNRRAIETDSFDSFLLRHIRDLPAETNDIYDATTPTTTTTTSSTSGVLSMVNDSHDDGTHNYTATHMTGDEYYDFVLESVNVSTTDFVFAKLKHFSWYLVSVQACREKESTNDSLPDCSQEVKTYVRTLKLGWL